MGVPRRFVRIHNPRPASLAQLAPDAKDGSALTGDELLDFVNNDLFKTLAGLELDQNAPLRQVVVQAAFTDANNYMKDGILLRQVVNAIDESVDFTEYKERHAFGEIYEIILKDLQSAGNAGEFYTPRAVTDFMAEMLAPKLGESVADFACGTGGFLTSALKLLAKQVNTPSDQELYSKRSTASRRSSCRTCSASPTCCFTILITRRYSTTTRLNTTCATTATKRAASSTWCS